MNKQDTNVNTMTMQVVLEPTRDLIADVVANYVIPQDGMAKNQSINLGSVLDSLASKGFELSPEQRLSYRDHVKALNVYVGKISDYAVVRNFELPQSAF